LQRVRDVLKTIIGGQELDLQRFANASFENIIALKNESELDDYTYRVAGCVGEFWTKMCRAHLFPEAKLDEVRLLDEAVRFGKGLQLVNILRDLPADLRMGRCYLPADKLAQGGLQPAELLQPINQGKFSPVYHRHLDAAEAHLAAGWKYTNTIQRGQVRVRLACAWPILIGLETIRRLRQGNILETGQRIKISRADVRRIIVRSVLWYPSASAWRRLAPLPA
jgi:farnesyl-diphosphate farnesyltransferase